MQERNVFSHMKSKMQVIHALVQIAFESKGRTLWKEEEAEEGTHAIFEERKLYEASPR